MRLMEGNLASLASQFLGLPNEPEDNLAIWPLYSRESQRGADL